MVTKKPITAAFLAALSQEVQPFLRRVRATRLPGAVSAWEFTRGPQQGVAVVSGMGEDAAAHSAAWVFERYFPGLRGSRHPGVAPRGRDFGGSLLAVRPGHPNSKGAARAPLAKLGEGLG